MQNASRAESVTDHALIAALGARLHDELSFKTKVANHTFGRLG
jgi:hypothetical protein